MGESLTSMQFGRTRLFLVYVIMASAFIYSILCDLIFGSTGNRWGHRWTMDAQHAHLRHRLDWNHCLVWCRGQQCHRTR